MSEPEIHFTVYGTAQPAGSKRPMPIYRGKKGARVPTGQTVMIDANPKAKDWKRAVAAEAAKAMVGKFLFAGPVALQLVVYRPRPKSHFGTGKNSARVKSSAPERPITIPDLTKLVRGTEDALRGIVWRDDAQVCRHMNDKLFGEPARADIHIYPLEGSLTIAEEVFSFSTGRISRKAQAEGRGLP